MSKTNTYKKNLDLIKKLHQKNKTITDTAKEFAEVEGIAYTDIVRRSISKLLDREGLTSNKSLIEDTDEYLAAKQRKLTKSKYYLATYAQNNTVIHKNFFRNLIAYKEFLNAELSCILGRYKNPTSVFSKTLKDQELWSKEILPYRDANRHDIHKYLTIAADIKVQPTAVNPLTGLEQISFDKTCIIGHPKLHMKSIAVLEGHPKKVLMTTGACTVPNYTDSKSGKKGESHHKLGFVIVEVKDEEIFYIRQVEADSDGNFYDLFHQVIDGEVTRVSECPALIMGDIHHRHIDNEVDKSTELLMKNIKPRELVLHDVLDGDSINHHEGKDPFKKFERYEDGRETLRAELEELYQWLEGKKKYNPIIVRSNHDEWIDKWLVSKDWKFDVPNTREYLRYALVLVDREAPKGILPYLLEKKFGDSVNCLGVNDSYKIKDYEVANHGYHGQNGSKGSILQFRRLNTKVVVGDYHTPSRYDDAIGVGVTCILRPPYNKGASGWLHCHAIIHENNTIQQVIFIEGGFTTFRLAR